MDASPTLTKLNEANIRLLFIVALCYFAFPTQMFGQAGIDIGSNFRTSGKTTNEEFVLCGAVNFVNRDTIAAVCAPRIIEDLSAYQGVNRIEITSIGGSGFGMTDADTSPTGLSPTNLTGNIIDPNTTKCINPGSNIYIQYKVYADPVVWGDGTSYNRISTITGNANNGSGPPLSETRSLATPSMTNANIILGASLTSFQNGTELSTGAVLEVNRDGTYDFTYRVTVGNYNNDTNTGDTATNIYYDDRLDGLYNNMPINSINTSPSAFGNLTVNPSFNGNASIVGGVNVTPDDVLISNGTLNPGQTDYVDITLNVGPIPLGDKGRGRWNDGFLSGEDSAGIVYTTESSDGLDPTQGVSTGPADTCDNGYVLEFDYAADIEITKIISSTATASSAAPGNYDLTYRVFVKSDDNNNVDIFRLSAIDEIANSIGSNFVRIVSAPVVTNIDTTSPPIGNGSFDGASGSGQGSGVDLLSGNNSNRLEPGQSFFIEYVIEVSSGSGDLINTIDFVAENSANTEYAVQSASYSYTIEDNDNDGILNTEDVDDDNDGILDINEVADSIDGLIKYSHNESSNRFNIDLDQPKILDWVLSNAEDERFSGNINVNLAGSELHINNITANNLTEAISNFDYIEYSLTTGPDVTELGVFQIYATLLEDGGSNFDRHGDSFKVGVILSTDDWASYQTIADGIEHKDSNGTSTTDFFYYHDGYVNSPLSWQSNTNYKLRVYFYDYVDDNPTRDYAVFDDFFITFSSLREQDTDTDGIPDYLDEDSDGDTCVDAVEAGHTDPDNDGVLGNSPVMVASNGIVLGQGGYTGTNANVVTPSTSLTFTNHPSDISVFDGGNAHFTSNITDSGLAYQWEESLDEGATWHAIVDGGVYSGATTEQLTLTAVSTSYDTNDYRLVVTDSNNSCNGTNTSNSANLNIEINNSSPDDFDNDSVDDATDLDDDNDGITDANEAQECIDDDYFEWGFNTPAGNRTNDFVQNPAITNWLLTNTTDIVIGTGITDASPGRELQIDDFDETDYLGALANDDYVEISFTTATNLIDPKIERMGVNWYRNSDGTTVGNAYDAAIAISTDNFTTSTLLNSDVRVHYPSDGVSEFFDLTNPSEPFRLEENTTYTVRIYAYNQQSDGNVAYSVFDDLAIRVSSCQERDTDGDGLPDHQDDDSDGDSCVDTIEAGHIDGDADGYLGTSPVAVDATGLVTGQGGYSGVTGNEIIATEITINTPPANQTANEGEGVNFTIDVSALNTTSFNAGSPDYSGPGSSDSSAGIIYQWRENGIDLTNSGVYSNVTTNTLTINDVTGLDGNTYTVMVSHTDNTCILDSRSAVLTANSSCDAAVSGLPDADGDGIADVCDLDDDNDGILDTDEGCGNLIINGSFEAQDFADVSQFPGTSTGSYGTFIGAPLNTNQLLGWSYDQNLDGWVGGGNPPFFPGRTIANAYHGNQFVDVMGSNGSVGGINNTLSQTIPTEVGQSYTFSFYWGEDIGFQSGWIVDLDVAVTDANNVSLISEKLTSIAEGPNAAGIIGPKSWFRFERTFIATTSQTTVSFYATPTDPHSGADIDKVSVVSNGPCTDTDNDGVQDSYDLDSDNDGIYDAVESGHNQTHSNGMVLGSVGSDGVPDAVQDLPYGELVNYSLAESTTDADTIFDFLDLDSDGDGLPDNVEAQTTIGYILPNNDNATTYLSNQGVNSAYLGGITPTNTDGTDAADYLDLDSDNEGDNDTLETQITLLNSDSDNDGLDDATDATADYSDVGGTIDDPLSGAIILLDTDKDATTGGDVDFRDTQDDRLDTDSDGIVDALDHDDDNDGILDTEELNVIIGNTQPDCTGETILDFSAVPVLESGTALQQGAVYRFSNVTAGTDVLLTIVETFNASVSDIDNNSSVVHAFRPRTAFDIANVGKEGYIEYRMQFVTSGGVAPVMVPKFFMNINDTDGNVDYSEEIYVENPSSYIISNPTELSVSYEFPWVVATGGVQEYPGADNTFPQINFGINYENKTEIRFRMGITTIIPAVANSGREHNIDFRCTTNYINPEIYVLDSDKDGVPNPIDLDVDNDGILDVIEAGHGANHTLGRVSGTVGADGVPDAVQNNPDAGNVNYTIAESTDDVDTIPNYVDLDADGDGIPDNVEAQTTVGYIAPSNVVDLNGLDTAYTSGIVPTNTDAADLPDYLDVDADNDGESDTFEATITLSGNDIDLDGLDDATDENNSGYADAGGTIDDPLVAPVILPDADADATTGGDVDFRDIPDVIIIDLDADDDGILDSFEDLNSDGDNDPATNPTNSDSDIYPDYLDIDSDNDGIPDNVEAQTTADYIPPSLIDANDNGLDDAYENGTEIGLIPVNTDNIDLPDYLDEDSDNDGILDNIEGNDYNADGIPDVIFIGSDKDNDGLDDNFEGVEQIDIDVNDEINSPINDLPNTDGDDESDYRDLDDDDDGIPTDEEDANNDGNYSNDDFDNDGVPDYLDPDQPIVIEDVEVFNVVTPNGDGAHDYLMITGLEPRPINDIRIFNRWGILIYTTESYNTIGNTFDGTSQGRSTVQKGEKLPAGTYFYILSYEDVDGSKKVLSGHLYLN